MQIAPGNDMRQLCDAIVANQETADAIRNAPDGKIVPL